ncbi:hypothetical protein [Streptomyces huiliensis]|uniref:hypothetical protein n=1 Tax=Streptomyces huiliensis TaxID=2876027 RepID=UPI001CBC76E6|nr:hypothetical protein [Streptomyces huiliensis]MBZ4322149.1 hypothetical protein [Streptomyces huiliensis]
MSFGNIFDTGGDQSESGEKSTEKIRGNTPGAEGESKDVRDLEAERDPWLVRQTAHGAFGVMEFLGGLFRNAQEASTAQRQASEDPNTVSRTASSSLKACGPPKADLRDEDLPKMEDLSRVIDHRTAYDLVTTGLGASEGLAVDPARKTVYVADRAGQKLSAVDVATGAQHVIASGLGDVGDVKVDGKGSAYVTDYANARLLVVNLSDGSFTPITGLTGAYGVALDGGKGRAYVVNHAEGQLFEVDLGSKEKKRVAAELGVLTATGVALDGRGKAYVGDTGGRLYEVDLATGRHHVLTTLSGAGALRVELDGAGKAYAVDPQPLNGRLYEITLADGAHRVVATGLQTCKGLALDVGDDRIYVGNQQGQLWQIRKSATEARGGVGQVVPPPGTGT